MSSEVPRVYRELIEEVIRSTDEDNYRIGIEKGALEEIKNTWITKICEYIDIGEYKIRHSYSDSKLELDGYYDSSYAYPEYGYRDYPYPYHYYQDKDRDDKKDRYNQYDGMNTNTEEEPQNQEPKATGEETQKQEEEAIEEELDSNELTESDCGIDNEESTKNVMLCLFDKVTRVKDKRRCTLKHGFLTIGRTDYTFSVANGDLEW